VVKPTNRAGDDAGSRLSSMAQAIPATFLMTWMEPQGAAADG
jgi:hypothetical protein